MYCTKYNQITTGFHVINLASFLQQYGPILMSIFPSWIAQTIWVLYCKIPLYTFVIPLQVTGRMTKITDIEKEKTSPLLLLFKVRNNLLCDVFLLLHLLKKIRELILVIFELLSLHSNNKH
jgi:hypothetical protein